MPLPMTVARLNRDLTNRLTVHFAGRIPPFVLLEHQGRTSGAVYRTPLMLFHDGGQVRIVLTYGERTDWLRNLQAAGGGTVIERGRRIPVSDPVIERGPQSLAGLPRFVRIVLGILRVDEVVRLNTGVQGEPAQN
jgi:deazaflavin-dependent oxidoreductase (nitroreductase family)